MEILTLPLAQEFNKTYTDVQNCDIIAPPFYTGRVPHSFFFKKRGAFSSVEGKEVFDEIYDTYESGNDTYYIGKIGTALKVKKNSTTLYTGTLTSGVAYKFFFSLSVKGTTADSGTGANGVIVGPDIVIQDLTKTWTVNAYSGKYVYIYEADTGTGQVLKIDSNTATDLVVTSTGWKVPPVNAKYYILGDYGYTLSFVDHSYVYTINNDSVVLPVKAVPNVIDALYFNGRYYIVDENKNIYIGDEGFFAGYFNQSSLIGSVPDVVNIANHRDIVLLLGTNEVNCIQSEKYTVQDTATSSKIVTVFKIVPVTKEIGLFTQNAYTIYNQGFYIVSKYRQILGVSITSVGIDKYFVDTKNQGMYIQKFLDNLSTNNGIRLSIDDQKMSLIVKDTSQTTIYNYDVLYLGWYRWITQLPLNNIKGGKYIGDTIYIKSFDAGQDEGGLKYNQQIRTIVGEENVYSMKRSLMSKFYIGKNTTKNAYIFYSVMAGGNFDTYKKDLIEAGYVQDILGYSQQTEGTLGSNILGMSMLGESMTNGLDLLADIALIENPTGFFYELHIIDIKAEDDDEIEFGGMSIGYTLFQPQVTPVRNVI